VKLLDLGPTVIMNEEKAKQCILCGADLPPDASSCPKCGTEIRTASAEQPKPTVMKPEPRDDLLGSLPPSVRLPDLRQVCPFCSMTISSSDSKCPRCGIPLRLSTEMLLECPKCGSFSPMGSISCPKCGVEFDVGHAPPPEPAPAAVQAVSKPDSIVTAVPESPKAGREGLVNGRAAVHGGTGLTNGRGRASGPGLVNGTGMVNGTGLVEKADSVAQIHVSPVKRWQFLAVLVALAIVIPTFLLIAMPRSTGPAIDGSFSDWAHAQMFDMQAPASTPDVTVLEWSVQTIDKDLFVYIETGTTMMSSSNVDSFYLFVDSDDSPGTGYAVSGLGADYMVELHGWDGQVMSSSLLGFDSLDQYNWSSWTLIGSTSVAISADKLEAMTEMPLALDGGARYMLVSQNNLPEQAYSASYPVSAKGGTLIVQQFAGPEVNQVTGTVPSSLVMFLRLVVRCEGGDGVIENMVPVVSGATLVTRISDITLKAGVPQTIDVMVDTSSAQQGSLVAVNLTANGVSSTFSDVVIVGDGPKAYVMTPPSGISIDGAFGDWNGRTSPDSDSAQVNNPNINMLSTGLVNTTDYAAFYVSVQGKIFQGVCVPSLEGKPSTQGGGGHVTPHRTTGQDFLRVYIDSDISNATGQLMQRGNKTIGADYMIEVDGTNGIVVSKSLLRYSDGEWASTSGSIAVGKDSQEIELSVASVNIGSSASLVTIIETTDWRERSDWAWAGTVPDPWVVDSSGNTYQSADGMTWSYLATPTLEPGDRIVDIAQTQDLSQVFLVTNTGRTYYWDLGTSTNWTAGETIPIDVATYSEAVSMAFYSSHNPSAWLMTKNSSYFWLMDATASKKPWTYQDTAASGFNDFTDLVYAGGTMYALRSSPNSSLLFSNNGNTFTSVTSPTGSTSNQTEFTFIPGGAGSADDKLFVLCEDGTIRNSSDGGATWNSLGNLPIPSGANSSKYVGLGIDPSGYMWVVTDSGYCYRSTDTTTYSTFICTGQSVGGLVAIVPMTAVPEFPALAVPLIATVLAVAIGRFKLGRKSDH
jgi:ribosomal protein L40E